MASAVNAAPSGTRSRTKAALAGSLTSGPSGVALPSASPHTTAANASEKRSACGGSRQRIQAAARTAKRSPAIAMIAARPQPICTQSRSRSAAARRSRRSRSAGATPTPVVATAATATLDQEARTMRSRSGATWRSDTVIAIRVDIIALHVACDVSDTCGDHPAARRAAGLLRRLSRLPRRPGDLRLHPRRAARELVHGNRADAVDGAGLDRRRRGRAR